MSEFNTGNATPFSQVELDRISELKKRLSDVNNEKFQDPHYLIRWLRARNLDVTKAEKMLRRDLIWREENKVDNILETEDVPEEMRFHFPMAYCGETKDDCIALLAPTGRVDFRGVLEKYGPDVCYRQQIINMEKLVRMMERRSKETGKKITQIVEIVDVEGSSYHQVATKQSRDFMTAVHKMMDEHYPEILKCCIVVNAPKVFYILYNIMKPLIPKKTLEKIQFYGPNDQSKIGEIFPLDKLPTYWGGKLEGVDEFCSGHEIWIQGRKDIKNFMLGLSQSMAGFDKVVIPGGSQHVKEIPVVEKYSVVDWQFKTEAYDIGFQITFFNVETGKSEEIRPNARLDSHSSMQTGFIKCENIGKYFFTFDNSFSLIRSKTLFYKIELNVPEDFQNCIN